MYVVCSHSDRIMRVYDFLNGELLAHASGHAEIITGMIFLSDCRRLVSVSKQYKRFLHILNSQYGMAALLVCYSFSWLLSSMLKAFLLGARH
jgi:hypothetical protein